MGEPAEMSAADRELARALAVSIVLNVRDDLAAPRTLLEEFSRVGDVPEDTLLLWLAQLVLEPEKRKDE